MGKVLLEGEYGGDAEQNARVERDGDEVLLTLLYPNLGPPRARYVVVDQESVRASDGIRLHYDYERGGWSIEQASTFEWEPDDVEQDPDWREVAFVPSWAQEQDSDR